MLQALSERSLIRMFGEIVPDFMNRSTLQKCYQRDKRPLAEKIIKYLVDTPSFDNQHQDILIKSFNKIMSNSHTRVLDTITDFLRFKADEDEDLQKHIIERNNNLSFHRNVH